MGKHLIMVHDLGTTGDKAVIFDESGKVIASEYRRYETYYPKPTWVEQDPEEWWTAVCESTKDVLKKSKIPPEDIEAVSLIGQQIGAVPVDKNGNLVRKRTIIWADARPVKQAKELLEKLGGFGELYKINGLGHIPEMLSLCKVMWLKENEPQVYENTYKFLQSKDFIINRLTDGEVFVDDYGDASNTGWLDIHKKRYATELLKLAGIDEDKLPEIRNSYEIVGEVGENAAEKTGLKKGTPIVLGTGDVPASCVGAGVLKEKMGFGYIGSANWGGFYSSRLNLDPSIRVINICHPIEDYVIFSYTPAGGVSLDWAKKIFYGVEEKLSEVMGVNIYDFINAKVREAPIGSLGVLYLPYLRSGGGPHWNPNARGVIIGLTMPVDKNHLTRAVMEGVALNFRWLMEQFVKLGFNVFEWGELRAIGGGILNPEWAKIYSDVLNMKITVPDMPQEATAKGGFVIAALALKIYKTLEEALEKTTKIEREITPNKGNHEKYLKVYDVYKLTYEQLKEVFDKIAELQEQL